MSLFELFLCSYLAPPTAANDDDYANKYDLPSTAHSLLNSEINSCRINYFHRCI